MSQILIVMNDDLFIGTWTLSKGFKVEHRALKKLIVKYKSEFEEIGVITSAMQKPTTEKGGRPVEEFLLNEVQATYLATLLTNNVNVRKFKLYFSKEFFRQRKILQKIATQRENADWLAKRAAGKLERRIETDAIKEFVEYATKQGSKDAGKYFMVISKMENQSLFALDFLGQKYKNLRDMVNSYGLDILLMADRIVALALKDGMQLEMFYKEIFLMAKDRVETFAMSIGKTPLRMCLPEDKLKKIAC